MYTVLAERLANLFSAFTLMEHLTTSATKLDLSFVRNQFPGLQHDFVFFDNAGGSQILAGVVDKISNFLVHSNAQLGASHEVSVIAGNRLSAAISALALYINAKHNEEVVMGSSTTMLLRILSICISRQWQPGDEIIVTNSDHEANVSCWMDLQAKGIIVKIWHINPVTLVFDISDLQALMTAKTRLVTMVHASNVLGTINPVRDIARAVHQAGALLCVDGVAYAPHRLIDVQALEVDFYVCSCYKFYGPHIAMLYGRIDLLKAMDGINHYFISKEEVPYKFQPGNFNYELTYSMQGVIAYFIRLHDHHFPEATALPDRAKLRRSFELIADHEQRLANTLLDYLKTKSSIRIIGHSNGDKEKRVPTISFIHEKFKSSEVVALVDNYRIGIRFGDFYAKKIIHDLGLEEKDGVIRVSMVHYNTQDEVQSLIRAFEEIFLA
jgi:cysteine desulfurase family protein (TIGR01976 family)